MQQVIKITLVLISLLFIFNTTGFAQDGEFKIGGGLALSTGAVPNSVLDNTFGFRAEGIYSIDEQWRGAANFTFYLPDEQNNVKLTVWELNFNAHYLINQQNDLTIYGLGGLNITSTDLNIQGFNSGSEFGLNLGAGLEYMLNFGQLYGEAKFGGVGGDADQFVFGAGLRFDI